MTNSNTPSGSSGRLITIILVLPVLFGVALVIGALVVPDFQQQTSPTATATTVLTLAIAQRATTVPTVTLVPPTRTPVTPTATATNTSTPTPVPPTATPSVTPLPPTLTHTPTRKPRPTIAAARCVSVVGDSVAHGDAVFEIPGTGYLQAQFAPLGNYIAQQYQGRGISGIQVYNRSSSAVALSSPRHPSYFGTLEYGLLLKDGCRYTVIVPWINDLSSGQDAGTAAPPFVAKLGTLAQHIASQNPGGKILVVNYYQGAAAPFALNSFASGFTPDNVAVFNQQIAAACTGGPLALRQVQCVDINAAFAGMGTSYLIGPVSQPDLAGQLYAPPAADQQGLVDLYFRNNPTGMLTGDGVHLSSGGKAQLAAYLVGLMP